MTLTAQAVRPIALDPAAPWDDLVWLDEVVAGARVVGIGEASHYNREFFRLRHRLTRYLVERHGFTCWTTESGFTESRLLAGADLDEALASGLNSLMGLWQEVREQLVWARGCGLPVLGMDLGGSNATVLPALDAVYAYLAQADPGHTPDPALRETVAAFAAASPFGVPAALGAYAALGQDRRDAVTAGLADLSARFAARRRDYEAVTGREAFAWTRHCLALAVALDTVVREMAAGHAAPLVHSIRDAAMAESLDWVLARHERVVLTAHNGHLQRQTGHLPGSAPVTPLGLHLADRLGEAYRVIGTTSGPGQYLNLDPVEFLSGKLFAPLDAPRPTSLDGVLAASCDGPFGVDLRGLSEADAAVLAGVDGQRFAGVYTPVEALVAYDALVHVPELTPATVDEAALECSPAEVREVFARWLAG
ncbi:erythromycin esterase [Crossiella equi]|uniref:Erythromycin esterase n=1 Tax=Crossiella equi TaxID=130796 RepID=A0ABS5APF1_9PSEU|nr:erythromycin esterase family protein [Crossiella equi]MBP2478455.1 erythromycin esterase [Crossiella equi]